MAGANSVLGHLGETFVYILNGRCSSVVTVRATYNSGPTRSNLGGGAGVLALGLVRAVVVKLGDAAPWWCTGSDRGVHWNSFISKNGGGGANLRHIVL